MNIVIKGIDSEFAEQLNQTCTTIVNYDAEITPDPADVAELKVINNYVQFVFTKNAEVQAYAHTFTNYKNQLHFGPSQDVLSSLPKAPVYPTIPVAISKGNARAIYLKFAKTCVANSNFTNEMGIALGFFAATVAEKDAVAVTPLLTAKLTTGGHPILHAPKGIYQGYEVWKDCNDGKGYSKLDTSLYTDYTDNSELPAIGIGKIWKYKVIYLLKGAQCGNWSAEATIGVFGQI